MIGDNSLLSQQLLDPQHISLWVRVLLILIIGIPLLRFIKKLTQKLTHDRLSPASGQLILKTVYYGSFLLLVFTVLNEFGFKISALLGVAGILGVAISFASQTSVSNIISGIFLISEKPFQIGDSIQVGSSAGTVESIDLLSIKIRTSDNRFVRIPNETMIKAEVINITKYPIRRMNVELCVSHSSDLDTVRASLYEIAAQAPLALKDKEPLVLYQKIDDQGIHLLYGVWTKTQDFMNLQNQIIQSIKQKFADIGIEIPSKNCIIYRETQLTPEIRNQYRKEGKNEQ